MNLNLKVDRLLGERAARATGCAAKRATDDEKPPRG